MKKNYLKFNEKGYPSINVYENYFEIKDIDYWEFRKFNYAEIKNVVLTNPNESFWKRLYIATSYAGRIFAKDDLWSLKVILKNGGDWKYNASAKYSIEFRKIIKLINKNISLSQ